MSKFHKYLKGIWHFLHRCEGCGKKATKYDSEEGDIFLCHEHAVELDYEKKFKLIHTTLEEFDRIKTGNHLYSTEGFSLGCEGCMLLCDECGCEYCSCCNEACPECNSTKIFIPENWDELEPGMDSDWIDQAREESKLNIHSEHCIDCNREHPIDCEDCEANP